jgi:hypothetical protein
MSDDDDVLSDGGLWRECEKFSHDPLSPKHITAHWERAHPIVQFLNPFLFH